MNITSPFIPTTCIHMGSLQHSNISTNQPTFVGNDIGNKVNKYVNEKKYTGKGHGKVSRLKHSYRSFNSNQTGITGSVIPCSPSQANQSSTHSHRLKGLMSSSIHGNDDFKNGSVSNVFGSSDSYVYPDSTITDAQQTVHTLVEQLQSSPTTAQKKTWEDLSEALYAIYKYQVNQRNVPNNFDQIKLDTLETLIEETPIITKLQFLVFKNWVRIVSINESSDVGFNNMTKARIYLTKLNDLLVSPHVEIQKALNEDTHAVFSFKFMKNCSDRHIVKKLLEVIDNTFSLCKQFKGENSYFFVRNALKALQSLLEATEESTFKKEIVQQSEKGFQQLFDVLTQEESTIIKQLSYLVIPAIKDQSLVHLSKFCQKTVVEDIYRYQEDIDIHKDNVYLKVKVRSMLDLGHPLIKQLPQQLENVTDRFIQKFGEALNISNQEQHTCILYIADSPESYSIFLEALFKIPEISTALATCIYPQDGEACIPTAFMSKKDDNRIGALSHEFLHLLLNSYAGFLYPFDLGVYGYMGFRWLNEALSYVLIADSEPPNSVSRNLMSKGRLPRIRDVIRPEKFEYDLSYSLGDYLFYQQKPMLDNMMVHIKNREKHLLIKDIERLISLEDDYHNYLMKRWNLPESMRGLTTKLQASKSTARSQTTSGLIANKYTNMGNLSHSREMPEITTPQTSQELTSTAVEGRNHSGWTGEKGSAAVKKITYGSMAFSVPAITWLVYVFFGMTRQSGGDGRRHTRRGEKHYSHDSIKCPEEKPLTQDQKRTRFSRKDSQHFQRSGNTQV